MDERTFKRTLRRTVTIPVAVLILLAVVLVVEILLLSSALRGVDHEDQVIADARGLMLYLVDMESAIRGFYLTGDRTFLEPYVAEKLAVSRELTLLEYLTNDDPEQHQRLEVVKTLDSRWIDYAEHLLGGAPGTPSPAKYATGKQLMDEIRAKQSELLAREEVLRGVRYRRATLLNKVVLATAIGLSLLGAVLLVTLTRRELAKLSDTYEKHLYAEKESSKRFQITLNSLGDAVIATDEAGRVRYINPVAQHLTGWDDYMEARGRALGEVARLIDERTHNELTDPVEIVRRAEKAQGLPNQFVLSSRTGLQYPIEMSGAPIRDDHGQLVGVVLVFRDATHRRQTEQMLRANDRLTHAGRLAATIAHEIRNPLETVSNLIFLLSHQCHHDPETKQYLELAGDELARITQITRQLLSFHREAPHPVQVDLTTVLGSVLALYSPQIGLAGIAVTSRFETCRPVRGFPGELRQVFSNLVANAVDSMPAGGRLIVHVYESSLASSAERKGVRVTVLDTGKGIPPAVRQKLFAPFYTTKGEGGTGLGLWITRGIIDKHEGTIHFISTERPGRSGTAFSVFLPFEHLLGKLDVELSHI
jgi:PAS domain S-box-containing protein